jgi:hypothetical protein
VGVEQRRSLLVIPEHEVPVAVERDDDRAVAHDLTTVELWPMHSVSAFAFSRSKGRERVRHPYGKAATPSGRRRIESPDTDLKQTAQRCGIGLVEPTGVAGFEPATYGFGDRRSTS